jgi:hypothetical protein
VALGEREIKGEEIEKETVKVIEKANASRRNLLGEINKEKS